MTPLSEMQKASIVRRIAFAELELQDLGEYEHLGFDTYSKDRRVRRDVERISENIANSAIDIGKIILAGEAVELPETYRDIFTKLAEIGVLDDELARALSDLVRLRNIPAHQYLDLKWNMIEDFLSNGKDDVKTFMAIASRLTGNLQPPA